MSKRQHWLVRWEDARASKVSVESPTAWQAARSYGEARADEEGTVGWLEAGDGSEWRVCIVREKREDKQKTVPVRFAVDRRTSTTYHSRILED
jgi:hypothetical protein